MLSTFKRFAVVRVPFPFTDRHGQKQRPAVMHSQPGVQQACGHLLLAMITSARQSSWPLDWPIEEREPAGLPQPCVVRLKLFTLDERLVLGTLGTLAAVGRTGVAARQSTLLPTTS